MRLLFLLLTLFLCTDAFAWGPKGHRVVADIARDHLNARARRAVVDLLGDDDLAAESAWADGIKRQRPETFGWHFVDIPWNAEGFNQQRDCYHPSGRSAQSLADHHNCIVDRIAIFQSVLADKRASRADRIDALKFVVHFVADVHQPFHAIGAARGGNDVHVVQFGRTECGSRPCDLHGDWDIGLIEHAHTSEREYARQLEELISREKLDREPEGTPEQWANESFQIAHNVWLQDGAAVDENYYRRNIPVVDEQLARAGIRLADLLNDALGK